MNIAPQNTAATSSDIANISLNNMLGYLDELTSLYQVELQALKGYDMKAFSDIQPRKFELVHECEVQVREFRARQTQLKEADASLKERVIAAQESLNVLASESQRLCKIRASSMARIQKRLLDAARDVVMRDKQHYNSKGKKTTNTKTRPVATALNEAI